MIYQMPKSSTIFFHASEDLFRDVERTVVCTGAVLFLPSGGV